MDINVATHEELARLPGMTSSMVAAVLSARSVRPITKVAHLLALPGFGRKRAAAIAAALGLDTTHDGRRLVSVVVPPVIPRQRAGIVLGTWNVQRLGLSKPDYALHAAAAAMVQGADIWALQEVMDAAVCAKLLTLLPRTWRACVSQPRGDK